MNKQEQTEYGFRLIMDIVQSAKAGIPYKEKIVEMWDIAEENTEVKLLVEHLILSLADKHGHLKRTNV